MFKFADQDIIGFKILRFLQPKILFFSSQQTFRVCLTNVYECCPMFFTVGGPFWKNIVSLGPKQQSLKEHNYKVIFSTATRFRGEGATSANF